MKGRTRALELVAVPMLFVVAIAVAVAVYKTGALVWKFSETEDLDWLVLVAGAAALIVFLMAERYYYERFGELRIVEHGHWTAAIAEILRGLGALAGAALLVLGITLSIQHLGEPGCLFCLAVAGAAGILLIGTGFGAGWLIERLATVGKLSAGEAARAAWTRLSRGWVGRTLLFVVAVPALLLATWFGINATDEELSSEAKALIVVPPPPEPSQKNGYLDSLSLSAPDGVPTYEFALRRLRILNTAQAERKVDALSDYADAKIDARLPACRPESTCLSAAAGHPELLEAIEGHRVFLARYRAMREKPEFIDLMDVASPDDEYPSYWNLFQGQRLSFLVAAVKFHAGDRAGAFSELEKENAFHRRMAVGGRTLLVKMLSYAALERDALFAADIARQMEPKRDAALWRRLETLVRAPTRDELDVVPSLRVTFAQDMRWMRTRRYVQLSDSHYAREKTMRPWWDPVAPYLYRPKHSLNLYAEKVKVRLSVAASPSKDYYKASEEAGKRVRMLEAGVLESMIVNPVGRRHPNLEAGYIDYICRMHGHSGVLALVRLQSKLRADAISRPEAVRAALAGQLGSAHADPFTGEPMHFDPENRTIGFATEVKCVSGASRALIRDGKLALPL